MTQPFSNPDLDARRSELSSSAIPTPDRVETLQRIATLAALGEAPLPQGLPPDELKIILAEVARLRRDRLVRFIARSIASDIASAGET